MPTKAMIVEIDQDKRERVLAPHRVRRFYLFFAPLALSFLFCGVGGWFTYDADDLNLYSIIFFAAALVTFAMYFVFESFYIGVYPARCYLRWLRENIERRPDAVVDADDPDAFFVQHIPRKKWEVSVGENATDVGLLLIDYKKGVMKYEGDDERWIIPVEAIVSFELESFTPPNGVEWLNRHTVVMLRIELDEEEVVLTPLAAHPIHWRRWTPGTREEAAEILRKAIGHLVDPKKWRRLDEDDLQPLIPPRR